MGLMDIQKIFDLFSFQYDTGEKKSSHEFLIGGAPYIPLYVPSDHSTSVRSILPIEGLDIPYRIVNNSLVFDNEWHGYLAECSQTQMTLNGKAIEYYIGNNICLSYRSVSSILDGGRIELHNNGQIDISPGLYRSPSGKICSFCGLHYPIDNYISALPMGRGFSFAAFLQANVESNIIITIKADLIDGHMGDYRTLYNVIYSQYGISYDHLNYIELIRGQILSQSPSTPHIRIRYDSRVRGPWLPNYPLPDYMNRGSS